MWIGGHDLLQLRSRRHVQPLRLRRRHDGRPRRVTSARRGTCAGRAPTRRAASSTSSNGELQVFDVKTGKSTPIAITVPDDGLWKRPPARVGRRTRSTTSSCRPKGERALFAARGDIFTAPIEKGPTRNLTQLVRRARQVAALVAGRLADRLHLRPDRRGRAVRRRAGRHRPAGAAHERRQGDALRAGVVAGRQADRVRRQGRQASTS